MKSVAPQSNRDISPSWATFYQIPIREEQERRRKRARMVESLGRELVGDNTERILPREIWLLIREYYELLLQEMYSDIGVCRKPAQCQIQISGDWECHKQHHIFCRDDYKLWFYHSARIKVNPLKKECLKYRVEPRACGRIPMTKEVKRHIDFGRTLYTLNHTFL